ncbi:MULTISPECIES: permease [Pacificibacter]|uniref:permease n=1 Tax=Pacificibacter TaxID=1042323 RepID=UPI001C097448|nr:MULTISPECIES: permease [Pacificibacter]MBU2936363.1 permease [Pacificibacter marinus]MDO6616599.1 permease [Pacificibacter sp. 1_MG-2023]
MQESAWLVALNEFLHVGGALVVIIAVVSVVTGIIREYIPQEKLQKKLAKHEKRGPLMGALLGTLTPFCSASMVPVVMGMAEMGASMGTIFGFLISAPLCNFVVVGLILATFGVQVTLIYIAITLGGAVLSGYLIGMTPLKHAVRRDMAAPATSCGSAAATACGGAPAATSNSCNSGQVTSCDTAVPIVCSDGSTVTTHTGQPHAKRLRASMPFAWALFKRIIPYVLIGAVISALSAAFLPAEMVEKYVGSDSWSAIPIAAGIGVPLYLRIEMALPLLQVLIAKGMGMGPAMALLIGGTGASLPEIAIISSVLKPKAVVAFVVTVLTLAMIGGGIFVAIA